MIMSNRTRYFWFIFNSEINNIIYTMNTVYKRQRLEEIVGYRFVYYEAPTSMHFFFCVGLR